MERFLLQAQEEALAATARAVATALHERPRLLEYRARGESDPPTEEFDDAIAEDAIAAGREVAAALQGAAITRTRNTRDGRAVVVSAAHPIWVGDQVQGAVVVEETTNRIASLRSQALERLLVVTLVLFTLVAAMLLWFATRISNRIRRLSDE